MGTNSHTSVFKQYSPKALVLTLQPDLILAVLNCSVEGESGLVHVIVTVCWIFTATSGKASQSILQTSIMQSIRRRFFVNLFPFVVVHIVTNWLLSIFIPLLYLQSIVPYYRYDSFSYDQYSSKDCIFRVTNHMHTLYRHQNIKFSFICQNMNKNITYCANFQYSEIAIEIRRKIIQLNSTEHSISLHKIPPRILEDTSHFEVV